MARIFTAKITHSTLTFSPFSSESMFTIGDITLSSITRRIRSATDSTDSPSKALTAKYANEKLHGRYVTNSGKRKFSGSPVRDWTLRGWTLATLKVKAASENRVTIGPTTAEANLIIGVRNKKDHMWGVSPRDKETMYAAVRQVLLTTKAVRVVRGKVA